MKFIYQDISEIPKDDDLPYLDKKNIDEDTLTDHELFFRNNGYLILEKFIPDHLIDAYCTLRQTIDINQGFSDCTPYMRHKQIKDLGLYPPLMHKLKNLIGHKMGMHLNLTGWKSTQRNWHQDAYLNPPYVFTHYIAVWFALDNIHPDSGPFEFIPGSHKWPLMRQHLLFNYYPESMQYDPAWPRLTQDDVAKACDLEIQKRHAKSEFFIANKGDILIWHAGLLHRGSIPKDNSLLRKSFIAHYSSIDHRIDMPHKKEHTPNCYYFELTGGPV